MVYVAIVWNYFKFSALSEEACELIGEEYSKLRSHDFENSDLARTQPVTARALETLIRLSTAHAKARLSKTVDREDAETAIELVQVKDNNCDGKSFCDGQAEWN